MAEIDVKDLDNKIVGKIDLSDSVFKVEVNRVLIWEALKHYADSLRSGTAATKTRARVSGSGKKPWRQKGTGRARVGSIRSPLWRHGGTVHGPQPRSYGYRFPRKKLRGALRSALAARFADDSLSVVESLELKSHKTKDFRKVLDGLGVTGRTLIVDSSANRNLELSCRNLVEVKVVPRSRVNIGDLVHYSTVLFSRDAILQVQEGLAS